MPRRSRKHSCKSKANEEPNSGVNEGDSNGVIICKEIETLIAGIDNEDPNSESIKSSMSKPINGECYLESFEDSKVNKEKEEFGSPGDLLGKKESSEEAGFKESPSQCLQPPQQSGFSNCQENSLINTCSDLDMLPIVEGENVCNKVDSVLGCGLQNGNDGETPIFSVPAKELKDSAYLEKTAVFTKNCVMNGVENSAPNDETSRESLDTCPQIEVEEPEKKYEVVVLEENLKNQKTEISRLREENERLRNNSVNCDTIPLSETTVEIYEVQMAALEKTITQLQKEVDHYRDKMTEQDEFTRTTIYTLKKDLSTKLEQMTKQCETCEKEKESMVVKYALSEKAVLTLKKSLEEAEKKSKENAREKDTMLSKIRALTNDKARLCQTIDAKTSEVSALQREAERTKEEITSRDIKIKWAQNKLKTEAEAHKECQMKLEKLEHKLKEAREESDQIRRDCKEMIRTYQESEEIKSNSLDLQLRERETELELERQEKCDQEEVYVVMKKELESLKKKHKISIEENNALTRKVQTLERERLDYEETTSRLKEQLNEGRQQIADLNSKVVEMQNMSAQIEREKERVTQSWGEIERLRQTNAELQIDMETCRRKEGELLEFTERLTSKNVSLISEFNCLEAKFTEQGRELTSLKKKTDEYEQSISALESHVAEEQQQRKVETQLLARKLAEKTKVAEILNLKVEEQNNENQVLKKKNAFTIRELTREVQTLHRRLENYEATRNGHQDGQNLGSRTSSTGSLDKLGFSTGLYQAGSSTSKANAGLDPGLAQGNSLEAPVEPTRQVLIERIVKLQWAHARKNEKIDFLEEHVSQLLKEIQRKSRLIQNYIVREDTGALATNAMDINKVELAKKGGIMSSLYLSQANDEGMTLELSLEICQKLQAVLEDTLLKNITLKENIKILGEEIEKLTKEQKHLR